MTEIPSDGIGNINFGGIKPKNPQNISPSKETKPEIRIIQDLNADPVSFCGKSQINFCGKLAKVIKNDLAVLQQNLDLMVGSEHVFEACYPKIGYSGAVRRQIEFVNNYKTN